MLCEGRRSWTLRRWSLAAAFGAGLALAIPTGAAALSITLAGPTSGSVDAGVGFEAAAPGTTLTFLVALDAAVSLNGYDLSIAWDDAELAFLGASDLSGLGFDVAPTGATPAGERVAAISLSPASTAALFQVQFQVLSGAVADGLADLRVFADPVVNGAGLAPGSLLLANAAGAGIDVPEPAGSWLLALAALGLAGCAAPRRSPWRIRE